MTVSLHDFILIVHIAAAIYLVGGSLISPAVVRRIRTAGTRAELLSWLGFLEGLMRANPPVAMALLGTGIYLGSAGWWNAGWFYVSVFAWILSSALAAAVIKPCAARIARTAAADSQAAIGRELNELRRAYGWRLAEKIMLGGDLSMIWIMVAKPPLVEAIAIFALLSAAVAALSLGFEKRSAAPVVLPS